MKKFTKLWQLTMILLLSSSIVFAQKEYDKVSTSAVKMEVVKETTPALQISEELEKQLVEKGLASIDDIKNGELSSKALEVINEESKAFSYNQEKPAKMTEVIAKNGGQPTDDLFCPGTPIYSLPANGFTSAGTSDIGPGYTSAQQFFGNYVIDSIHWWGINQWFSGAWQDCGENPMDFQIIFYEDNAGVPGTVVGTYNAAALEADSSGSFFNTAEILEWSFVLPSAVTLSNGWISIQGNPEGNTDCWFLWVNSGTAGPSGVQDAGTGWGGVGYPYSLCVYGDFANTNDLVTTNVLNPNSGFLTATESVTMEIFNNGTATQSNIPVSFSLDGAPAVNEVYAGPLAPGAYGTYTFTQTIDCSATGTTYSLECCANLVGDEDATNDCYTHSFASFAAFDCDWYIVGLDDYGDGWNNGAIEIFLDGISVFTYTGPTSAQGLDPDTAYFGIWEGSTLSTALISGSYDYEMSYYIYNNFDVEQASDGLGGIDPVGVTIDPVTCLPPACPEPINLETTAISLTGARAGWDPGGTETAWNFEWGPAGFTLGSGTAVPTVTSGYIFPTLESGTYYDWYVQANCGSDVSGWVGPITFQTLLPTVTIPVYEDFEVPAKGQFNITGNNPANDVDWVIVDTMSYGGTSAAFNVYAINNINILELTQQFDLTGINAQLTFWHIAKTEGGWDFCYVDISTDGGATYTPIPASNYLGSGVYNDRFDEDSYPEWGTGTTPIVDTMWMQEKFNLTPYNTFAEVTIRFRLTSDGSVQRAGWMIDDIAIEELACPPPIAIGLDELFPTTATISWTSTSLLSNIEWDSAGFVQGTGTTITGNTTGMLTLSSLEPNATYDVYIQDDCSGTESDWVLFQFTTSCTECPAGSTPEGEICGDDTNGGCNMAPGTEAFTIVADGVTICGNVWDDGSTKDTDWFQLDLATGFNKVTIEASGDVDLIFGLLEQTVPGVPGCANITGSITPIIFPSACDTASLEIFLDAAGTYYFWLAQEFWTGNVCPGSRYWASWTVEQLTEPLATIDPTSFDVTVPELGSATRDLTIGNDGGFPLAYSAMVDYGTSTPIFSETFDTEIPATWSQVLYSGTGVWSWTNTATSFLGSDGSFAQANDSETGADYDVGLFTPTLDLSGYSTVVLEFDRNFQDFAGSGIGTVKTYSGGTDVANFEEELLFLTVDDPGGTGTGGGVHTVLSFDPSAYANSADVYIEFYYTDEAYAGAWFFKIDNVEILGYSNPIGWLTLDGGTTVSNTLLTTEQDVISVGFDATGLALGTYTADIAVETNEPASDASYVIPVSFTVAPSWTVSGTLTYANGASTVMDLVDVSLMDGTTEVGVTATDEFGAFSFSTIDGTYSYMASTTKPRGGTNILDAINTRQYLGGGYSMNALQQSAANVNNNVAVDILDAIFMQQSLSGPLPPGWTAPDYLFEDPTIVVSGANTVQDFQSLCSGDPNGSFIPPNFCPLPTGLTITNLTASSGDATWASLSGLSNLEYGPSGFTPGTGTILTGVTSPQTITGVAGDVIDVYVQDDCGGLSQSDWVGPVTFTIPLPGAICETAISIPGAPFIVSGLTTCGFGDDYSSADACGSSYMNGDDFVFEYTPGADITVDIALTNTDTWVGVFVTDGCPDVGSCVTSATSSSGNPSISALDLTGGITYYITISTWPSPQCTPFDISITEYVPPTAITPPYLEPFDTFLPADWSEATAGDPTTGPSSPGSGNWTGDIWLNVTGGSPCSKVNLYSNTTKDWLISPEFDLSAGGYDAIFDVAVVAWGASTPSNMGSDDQVQFLISNDGGATWIVLATYNNGNKPSELGQTETISLAAYTGASVFFAFWADDGIVNDAEDYDFMVDTFKVE